MADTLVLTIPAGGDWLRLEGPIAAHVGFLKLQNRGRDELEVNENPEGDPSARAGALPPEMSHDGGDVVPIREDWINSEFNGATFQLWLRFPGGSGGKVSVMFG